MQQAHPVAGFHYNKNLISLTTDKENGRHNAQNIWYTKFTFSSQGNMYVHCQQK